MGIRVLLADDHGVVREGVRRLLEADEGIKVVAVAENGQQAIEKCAQLQPDVVIMDVSMPSLNGIEATRLILQKAPAMRVVMLSMHSSAEVIRQALRAGARGYVLKESAGAEVVRAVKAVASGQDYMGSGVGDKVVADCPDWPAGTSIIDSLTHREREILQLVTEGKSNAQAAAILGLSPRSVETYRGRLMHKLGIEDLPSLVKFAIRHGIVSAD